MAGSFSTAPTVSFVNMAVLSQEFKQRLKQEYLSLGGSPNTVCSLFWWMCMHAYMQRPAYDCKSAFPDACASAPVLQPMGSNYFLWIIVIVSVLAVLSWALGYI